MGLQVITHHSSPYSEEYINAKGNGGFTSDFQTSMKGLHSRRKQKTKEEISAETKKALATLRANPNRVPWDWE